MKTAYCGRPWNRQEVAVVMEGSEVPEMVWVEVPLPPGVDRVALVHWHLSMLGFERARARLGVPEVEVREHFHEDGSPDFCAFTATVGEQRIVVYGRGAEADRVEVTVNDRP